MLVCKKCIVDMVLLLGGDFIIVFHIHFISNTYLIARRLGLADD